MNENIDWADIAHTLSIAITSVLQSDDEPERHIHWLIENSPHFQAAIRALHATGGRSMDEWRSLVGIPDLQMPLSSTWSEADEIPF
jgi:hypothetical protein